MPEISVIVPVYNVEKYLHECIDSILAQTFTDFELILVNDGSQDNSGAICDEYANKDNRITVIHQKNQGQAAARNNAIAIAKGEWIHFVDSDDLIHPQILEILYGAVDETTQISMCNVYRGDNLPDCFFAPKSSCNFKKHPINEDELISMYNDKYQYWIACAKLIKKEIIEKFSFTPGRIYEDNGVVFKWLNQTEFVNITSEQLYFYRINPNSTTQVDFSLKNLDYLWAFKEQIDFFYSLGYKKMTEHLATNYFEISAYLYHRAKTENAKELIPHIKEKEKEIKDLYSDYIKLNTKQKLYYYERTNKPMFYITRLKRKLGLLK